MVDTLTPAALDALEQDIRVCVEFCAVNLTSAIDSPFVRRGDAALKALVAAARERDAWRQERDQCLAGAATVQKALTAERDTLRAERDKAQKAFLDLGPAMIERAEAIAECARLKAQVNRLMVFAPQVSAWPCAACGMIVPDEQHPHHCRQDGAP